MCACVCESRGGGAYTADLALAGPIDMGSTILVQ